MLFKLLTLPLTLPASGIKYVFERIADITDEEMNSEEPIKEQLLQLQIDLEEGRVDEDAYAANETVLLARLREIRERRRAAAREQVVETDEDRQVVIELPEELR